jgi:hypothetical protein
VIDTNYQNLSISIKLIDIDNMKRLDKILNYPLNLRESFLIGPKSKKKTNTMETARLPLLKPGLFSPVSESNHCKSEH